MNQYYQSIIIEGSFEEAIIHARNCCRAKLCIKGESCRCRICQSVLDGTSFNVGEFGGQNLSVEQVRKGIQYFDRKSKNFHAVIFSSGFGLSEKSAAALLKIIEEPPVNVQVFLILRSQWLVPTTILSRCKILQVGNILCGDSYTKIAEKSFEERLKVFWQWQMNQQFDFRVVDIIHSLWLQKRYEDMFNLAIVLVQKKGISVNDVMYQTKDIQ